MNISLKKIYLLKKNLDFLEKTKINWLFFFYKIFKYVVNILILWNILFNQFEQIFLSLLG